MSQRKGGIIFLKIDGIQYQAKGNFTYGLGKPTREAILGASGRVDGYKETLTTPPHIEGEITDSAELSAEQIANITNGTATLELANGKVISLRGAFSTNPNGYSGQTEDGNIQIRLEGDEAIEVR